MGSTPTDYTEGLAGELQPASPSPVAAAAACCPDPHNVLHTKHHDGHDFLQAQDIRVVIPGTASPVKPDCTHRQRIV